MFAVYLLATLAAAHGARTVPTKAENPSLWKPVRSLITLSALPQAEVTQDVTDPMVPIVATNVPTTCHLEVASFDFGLADKGCITVIPGAKEGPLTTLKINRDAIPIDAFSHLVVTLGEGSEELSIEYAAAGENSNAEVYRIKGAALNMQVTARPGHDKLCLTLDDAPQQQVQQQQVQEASHQAASQIANTVEPKQAIEQAVKEGIEQQGTEQQATEQATEQAAVQPTGEGTGQQATVEVAQQLTEGTVQQQEVAALPQLPQGAQAAMPATVMMA